MLLSVNGIMFLRFRTPRRMTRSLPANSISRSMRYIRAATRPPRIAPRLALILPIVLVVVAGAVDFSLAVVSRTHLRDAAAAASVAVAAATAADPAASEGTLKALAQLILTAKYQGAAPIITDFHVCVQTQNDCTDDSGAVVKRSTVTLGASAPPLCGLAAVPAAVCAGGTRKVSAHITTVINPGAGQDVLGSPET